MPQLPRTILLAKTAVYRLLIRKQPIRGRVTVVCTGLGHGGGGRNIRTVAAEGSGKPVPQRKVKASVLLQAN